MIKQSSLSSYTSNLNRKGATIKEKDKSSTILQVGLNEMIFCPQCNLYVGAIFKGSFWECSRRGHKIKSKKEVKNDK